MILEMIEDNSPTPLWKFVTDHQLVFAAEVLTKFDEFDLKIFYDLCRASREVVIRSNIELNNDIRHVENVKSMQELALAWDNYRFGEINMVGGDMTQEKFCVQVAWTNNLDFLKWAREVKQCAWDEDTIIDAASGGDLEMVKYCVENDCPMNAEACSTAALNGHLDVLKYLREHDCPWDSETCLFAHQFNHVECLNYAIKHECPGWQRFDPEHPDYDPPVYSDEESEEEEDVDEHD